LQNQSSGTYWEKVKKMGFVGGITWSLLKFVEKSLWTINTFALILQKALEVYTTITFIINFGIFAIPIALIAVFSFGITVPDFIRQPIFDLFQSIESSIATNASFLSSGLLSILRSDAVTGSFSVLFNRFPSAFMGAGAAAYNIVVFDIMSYLPEIL
jgi:hypothetical protein